MTTHIPEVLANNAETDDVEMRSKAVRDTQQQTEQDDFKSLLSHVSLPLIEAAAKLGMGISKAQIMCRKFGLTNWPWRKIQAIKTISNYVLDKNDKKFITNAVEHVTVDFSIATMEYMKNAWPRISQIKNKYRQRNRMQGIRKLTWKQKRKRSLKQENPRQIHWEVTNEPRITGWRNQEQSIIEWWNKELYFPDTVANALDFMGVIETRDAARAAEEAEKRAIDLYCYEILLK